MEHNIKQLVRRRVHRGVRLLDEWIPNWREQIVPEKLDLGSGGSCIVGQLYGNYFRGVERLGINNDHLFGFNIDVGGRNYNYSDLTDAWLEILAK